MKKYLALPAYSIAFIYLTFRWASALYYLNGPSFPTATVFGINWFSVGYMAAAAVLGALTANILFWPLRLRLETIDGIVVFVYTGAAFVLHELVRKGGALPPLAPQTLLIVVTFGIIGAAMLMVLTHVANHSLQARRP